MYKKDYTTYEATCTQVYICNSLRAQVVTLEQPDLEERHHDLITSIATDQKQLLDIEDQILGLLNNAGSGVKVLDDEVRSWITEAVNATLWSQVAHKAFTCIRDITAAH